MNLAGGRCCTWGMRESMPTYAIRQLGTGVRTQASKFDPWNAAAVTPSTKVEEVGARGSARQMRAKSRQRWRGRGGRGPLLSARKLRHSGTGCLRRLSKYSEIG